MLTVLQYHFFQQRFTLFCVVSNVNFEDTVDAVALVVVCDADTLTV